MSAPEELKKAIDEKRKQDAPLIECLRENLVPKGTKPVVRISINAPFFKQDFINECIDEMEMKLMTSFVVLDPPSKLEILAMEILKDSTNYG